MRENENETELVFNSTVAPADILKQAQEIISGPRRKAYGSAVRSFTQIAALWSAYLDQNIEPRDVAMMMILLKTSRQCSAHNEDNLIDICGYAALACEVEIC